MNMKHTGTSKITAAVVVLLIAALAVMLLTGCTSKSDDAVPTATPEQEEVTPTPTPEQQDEPEPTQTPEITPEPTPTPQPKNPVVNQVQSDVKIQDVEVGEQDVNEAAGKEFIDFEQWSKENEGVTKGTNLSETTDIHLPTQEEIDASGKKDIHWVQNRRDELIAQGMEVDEASEQAQIEGGWK